MFKTEFFHLFLELFKTKEFQSLSSEDVLKNNNSLFTLSIYNIVQNISIMNVTFYSKTVTYILNILRHTDL